jgi:hypothetical protein
MWGSCEFAHGGTRSTHMWGYSEHSRGGLLLQVSLHARGCARTHVVRGLGELLQGQRQPKWESPAWRELTGVGFSLRTGGRTHPKAATSTTSAKGQNDEPADGCSAQIVILGVLRVWYSEYSQWGACMRTTSAKGQSDEPADGWTHPKAARSTKSAKGVLTVGYSEYSQWGACIRVQKGRAANRQTGLHSRGVRTTRRTHQRRLTALDKRRMNEWLRRRLNGGKLCVAESQETRETSESERPIPSGPDGASLPAVPVAFCGRIPPRPLGDPARGRSSALQTTDRTVRTAVSSTRPPGASLVSRFRSAHRSELADAIASTAFAPRRS